MANVTIRDVVRQAHVSPSAAAGSPVAKALT